MVHALNFVELVGLVWITYIQQLFMARLIMNFDD